MTATSISDFDDKENLITACCSPSCVHPKILILRNRVCLKQSMRPANYVAFFPLFDEKAVPERDAIFHTVLIGIIEDNLKLHIIYIQQGYKCRLIISICNMSVYNNSNYTTFRNSFINMNLFLLHNDYFLTKLNTEKDNAGPESLICKTNTFSVFTLALIICGRERRSITLSRYEPLCVPSSGNCKEYV